MQRAGVVTSVAQGVVVLVSESNDLPSIGVPVVNETLERVGRIVDVIGPVDRPYLVVSPGNGIEPATLLGTTLYIR